LDWKSTKISPVITLPPKTLWKLLVGLTGVLLKPWLREEGLSSYGGRPKLVSLLVRSMQCNKVLGLRFKLICKGWVSIYAT
jgi:hypothetical protein